MKQITIVLLLFAVLSAFVGCGNSPADTTPSHSTPAETTPAGTEKTGEFVVSGKKYTYENKDVLLLNVENQTDKDYNVTAIVHYFDAEGNELKTQKLPFTGWASGFQNYFLFQPNITFETFTYTLELEEFEGEECYTQYIGATFSELTKMNASIVELIQKKDYTKHPVIKAVFKVENRSTNTTLWSSGFRVVFDNTGNIFFINYVSSTKVSPQYIDDQYITVYYDLTSEDFVWPEELTGDVSGVYVITRVWQ